MGLVLKSVAVRPLSPLPQDRGLLCATKVCLASFELIQMGSNGLLFQGFAADENRYGIHEGARESIENVVKMIEAIRVP